jgi:hypothetical protein
MEGISYRVYANGWVVSEDEFDDYDNAQPYYDDYVEVHIPNELLEYLQEG